MSASDWWSASPVQRTPLTREVLEQAFERMRVIGSEAQICWRHQEEWMAKYRELRDKEDAS